MQTFFSILYRERERERGREKIQDGESKNFVSVFHYDKMGLLGRGVSNLRGG